MAIPNYPGDPKDSTDDTPFDALKDQSLKAAGYAYLLGDGALFASGMMGGRSKEAMSGLLYTVGGLACAKYANPDAEKQLKLLSHRLGDYLRKEGVEIPVTPETKDLVKPGGVIDHIEAFLYKYPSQVLNATYAIGGVQLLRSGMQHGKHWDTASGALVAAGGLAGLLIHEKKPDPEHPPSGFIGKAVSWLQEKPLRISGGLYALNNATLIMSALEERRANPAQKSYLFKFLTAASYIFGNTMLSLSSKNNHSQGSSSQQALEKLAETSARIVAAQPPEVREGLVQHIAGYIASQPEVELKAEELTAMMQRKMQEIAAQPAQGGWQGRVSESPAHPSPAL
jgi:hypothetical protein